MINEFLICLLTIIFILTEMNKTKSTTPSGHSTSKPFSISTNTKCIFLSYLVEKLDQVNNMVHEIS